MAEYNRKDRLYQQAKEEGYRSRASYKLIELNKRFRFLRPGQRVLDLGCFPGGWLQVAAEAVGASGKVVGIDLKDVSPITPRELHLPPGQKPPAITIVKDDVGDADSQARLIAHAPDGFDSILCDMSPNLSGIVARDSALTAELVGIAFKLALRALKPKGTFVAKAFPSEDIETVIKKFRSRFAKFQRTQLDSSRSSSNEFYIVASGPRRDSSMTAGEGSPQP